MSSQLLNPNGIPDDYLKVTRELTNKLGCAIRAFSERKEPKELVETIFEIDNLVRDLKVSQVKIMKELGVYGYC